MHTRLLFLIVLLCFSQISLQAQEDIDFGISLGAMNYQGDFAASSLPFNQTNFAIGAQVRRTVIPEFGIRLGVLFGKITGDYSSVWAPRDWQFERNVTEISLMGEWHPWGKPRIADGGTFTKSLSPYIALGTAFVFGDYELNLPDQDLESFQAEQDLNAFLVLPINVGLRYFLTKRITIAAEVGTRYTFSDALDGVSVNGNPDANDWYVYGGVSVFYLIRPDKRVAYDFNF